MCATAAPAAETPTPVGPPASSGSALSLPAPSGRELRGWKLDSALIGLGQVGDLASTEIALRRPGTQEGNALLKSRGVRIPVKLALAVGGTLAVRELRKRDKTRQARIFSIAMFAVGAAAAGHNLHVASGR